MNKSFVKFVTDFGPLVVFFFFYYNSDKNLKIAIPPFVLATIISLLVVWIIEKKIPNDLPKYPMIEPNNGKNNTAYSI